jgi:hypothetical protein
MMREFCVLDCDVVNHPRDLYQLLEGGWKLESNLATYEAGDTSFITAVLYRDKV